MEYLKLSGMGSFKIDTYFGIVVESFLGSPKKVLCWEPATACPLPFMVDITLVPNENICRIVPVEFVKAVGIDMGIAAKLSTTDVTEIAPKSLVVMEDDTPLIPEQLIDKPDVLQSCGFYHSYLYTLG